MSDPVDDRFDRGRLTEPPEPARPGDLTDLSSLPGEFRAFARDIRSSFELLTNRIVPSLLKIETALVDLSDRVSDIERHQLKLDQRLDDLEARIPAPRRRALKR